MMYLHTIYRYKKQVLYVKEYDMLMRQIVRPKNIDTILKTVNCPVHNPLKRKLDELEQPYVQ